MRHSQRVRQSWVMASLVGRSLTRARRSDVLLTMLRKKSPRLAAAFVVTLSAGCGSASSTPTVSRNPPEEKQPPKETGPENPDWVPNLGAVPGGFVRGGDGKCYIQHPANPPWMEPADCETQQPLQKPDAEPPKSPDGAVDPKPVDPKPPETPAKFDDSNLPEAPAHWRVTKHSDGRCTAKAPSSPCPKGAFCNPPPPQTVKCPKTMPKEEGNPQHL